MHLDLEACKRVAARWVIPLTMLAAVISVSMLGVRANVVLPNLVVVANALVVALWFRDRRDGVTAFYFVSRTDPDEEDTDGVEWLMFVNALLTVITPFYFIVRSVV